MSYNNEFMDNMDTINNIAKSMGFVNGISWSDAARKSGEISQIQHMEHEKCHKLRNVIAHGNAKDIAVSNETLNITKEFLKRMKNTHISNNVSLKKDPVKSSKEMPLPKRETQNNVKQNYDEAVAFVKQFQKVSKGLLITASKPGTNEIIQENLCYGTNALQYLEKYLECASDEKKVEIFKLMKDIFSVLEMEYYLPMIANAKVRRVFHKYDDQSVENCESCYHLAHKIIASRDYKYDLITISDLKSLRNALNKMVMALNQVNRVYV